LNYRNALSQRAVFAGALDKAGKRLLELATFASNKAWISTQECIFAACADQKSAKSGRVRGLFVTRLKFRDL
jgi:hypothetical protein